uniref:Ribonuclease H protein At1g65750 family n=1 Tax=Cajanus cajan TaxID=3821 RepID=A0A151T6U4_CAJCA|nr:Putative ribonuclease H protein At1g65750 family [Cajanus cajan]
MSPLKAPGPDGFQAFFYKKYWQIVGRDLHNLVQNAFSQGRADQRLLDTNIVLIPKSDNPMHFKDFRPISLCNVAYKVITKVLVDRIRPYLSTIIGPYQSSFIPGRGFTPSRGLRQGDPLSPYLFVLCMERLALKINELVDNNSWKPAHLSRGGPPLSHLMFADDLLLFGEATEDQARVMERTLEDFCRASGLKINQQKSKFVCSKKIINSRLEELENLLGIKKANSVGKYLGHILISGRATNKDFEHVTNKVKSRIASWKGKLLNRAGRICLAKSVITSIPVYTMQAYWLPQRTCDHLNQLCRRFIWSKDGTSRRKQIWKYIMNPETPWVKFLKHKYLKSNSILTPLTIKCPSYVWKSIKKAVEVLKYGFEPKLGLGRSSVFYEDWLGDGPLCTKVPFVHISDTQLSLADIWVNNKWNLLTLHTNITKDIEQKILKVKVPPTPVGQDTFRWSKTISGEYTTSSAYNWLQGDLEFYPHPIWKQIWQLQITKKLRVFCWSILNNALPTNSKRKASHMSILESCPRCSATTEDAIHALRDCPKSKELWNKLDLLEKNLWMTDNILTWVTNILKHKNTVKIITTMWWAWRWRNNHIFDEEKWDINKVIRHVYTTMADLSFMKKSQWDSDENNQWQPLADQFVKVNVDGSFNPSSSVMTIGGSIRDRNGKWIFGFSKNMGRGDHILAELYAIKLGLEICWNKGWRNIICETDCREAMKCIIEGNNLRHSHLEVIDEINHLRRKTWNTKINCINRETNKVADILAKKTCSGGDITWPSPPNEVIEQLTLDSMSIT